MKLTEDQYTEILSKRKTSHNRVIAVSARTSYPTEGKAEKTAGTRQNGAISAIQKPVTRHKFGARSVVFDGIKFQSTLEGNYYNRLKARQAAGEVIFFLRQTTFHLPGNVTYTVDFTVYLADGTCEFIDVKGVETKEFIRAKKQVEALYPVTIRVVKKGEF